MAPSGLYVITNNNKKYSSLCAGPAGSKILEWEAEQIDCIS